MTPALFKIFERYNLGEKAMLCLWYNGQLNTVLLGEKCVLECSQTFSLVHNFIYLVIVYSEDCTGNGRWCALHCDHVF
jgi:hypothetical protein